MSSTTTTPEPVSTAETTAPKMTHREVLESLSGILLGMFVSILATSVVSSSLPRIRSMPCLPCRSRYR